MRSIITLIVAVFILVGCQSNKTIPEEELMDSNVAFDILNEELRGKNNIFEQEGIIVTSADVIEDTQVLEVGLLEVTPDIEKRFRKLLKNELLYKSVRLEIIQSGYAASH